jgi:hypothetical protein
VACTAFGLTAPYPQAGVVLLMKANEMATPAPIDIARRAYELWHQAGEPKGRDQEFYLQAEKELQEALDRENSESNE